LHDLFKRFGTNPPHILVSGWLADYPDPDTFMRVLINSRAAGWEDKTYQRLIEQARGLTDQRARMALYGQAERILAQEAPLVPLVYSRNPLLVKPWVKGFLPSAGCQACWKHVILQPH
jgi:oligopeptide transport system substrate-binding protein